MARQEARDRRAAPVKPVVEAVQEALAAQVNHSLDPMFICAAFFQAALEVLVVPVSADLAQHRNLQQQQREHSFEQVIHPPVSPIVAHTQANWYASTKESKGGEKSKKRLAIAGLVAQQHFASYTNNAEKLLPSARACIHLVLIVGKRDGVSWKDSLSAPGKHEGKIIVEIL